ncbi:hypothetical protein SAMN05444156_2140 [Verrucomicrobium sp. GAS474]|uniref:hypothetical protein n=1 Tax=Verrucomicrobium sp. GAS474 TaxID=1882831 RepID=UPI00087D2DA0|nr:hypothetical protein [Verrucomicrobium sp. GAS474]SDU13099.1 hypothetical protein SAMN05444156_2140 [Verrucomicrobium sp. GAS474]
MTKLAVFFLIVGGIAPALFLEGAYLFASAGGADAVALFDLKQPELARLALLFGGGCFFAGMAVFIADATIDERHAHLHDHDHAHSHSH